VVAVIGEQVTSGQPIDIQVRVQDSQGTYRDDVNVQVLASNGTESWSGVLPSTGANGIYRICDVGSFSTGASTIIINATASKAGYISGSGTATCKVGNLSGCP
jgi:hypothetical protein